MGLLRTNGPGAIAFGRAPGIGVVGRTAELWEATLVAFGGTGPGGRVMMRTAFLHRLH